MAYRIRYFCDFADVKGLKYRINFFQKDYLLDPVEILAGAVPFVHDIQQDHKYDEIAAAIFDIEVITQNGFTLLDIYTSDSREWRIDLIKRETEEIVYTGWLESIKGGERLKGGRQTLRLTASCGIEHLSNIPFQNQDGTPYKGLATKRGIIQKILFKTGLGLNFGIASNWVNNGDGAYSTTAVKVLQECYYKENGEPYSCLEVLKDILLQLNCEIFQQNGTWWIRNVDLLSKSDYDYYIYDANGVFVSLSLFTNTPLQLGNYFKTTLDSFYSAAPPVKRFEAILELGRYKNQLPNGDFSEAPRVNLPQWTNTLFSTEIGGTGTVSDRVYVKIFDNMRSPNDVKASDIVQLTQFIFDINTNLKSSSIPVESYSDNIYTFKGWINASGSGTAVCIRFQVQTTYGNFWLKQDGTFEESESSIYKAETFFEFYPDFKRSEGATRVGAPVWTEVSKDLDLSYFKRLIETYNRGPRDNSSTFLLQGITIFVYPASVRSPEALNSQFALISNFRINKREQREIASQVHFVENDVITPEKTRTFNLLSGDYFDTTELATTYFGNGTTPTSTHEWTNPQTSQSGGLFEIFLTERAKQHSRVHIRIEGQVEGRQWDLDFNYDRICTVSGFSTKKFKQIRRRCNLEQKSTEIELLEII